MSESSRRRAERDDLRRRGRTFRQSISEPDRSAAERALAAHLRSLHIARGATVGSFVSDDGEPRLDAPLVHQRSLGLACALPVPDDGRRVGGPRVELRKRQMSFRLWRDGDDLVAGPLDIPVPPPGVGSVVVPDVLLVPLVAFDDRGNRLGRGAGFYDRYLATNRTSAGTRPTAIGVAFEGQRLAAIPAEPYDQVLDLVVTELGIRWIRPKGTS